jgi:hypothetical protein
MTVSFVLTSQGNPGNPEALRKFYAQAKSNGELTLRKLSKKIAESSTTEQYLCVGSVERPQPFVERRFWLVSGRYFEKMEQFENLTI